MGGNISSSNLGTSSGKHEDDRLQLVLYVLPIVKELAKQLEQNFDPRDKRYGFLGNIYAAATVLDGHLCAIEEAREASSFKAHTSQLADLLEEVFSETVIDSAQLQLSQDTPYCRLRAVRKLVPKSDGWETRLQNVQLVSTTCLRVAWDRLQRGLEELSDELQKFGEDMPGIEKPKPPATYRDAAGEIRAFADRVFSKLSCSNCNCGTESQREVRLKIGTYRKRKLDQENNCLCILLAQDSPQHGWYETLIHDIQQSALTPKVKFVGTEATSSHTASWCMDNPRYYPCLCSLLKSHSKSGFDFLRLNIALDLANEGIQRHEPDERMHKPESLLQEVNLKTLLDSQARDWTAMTKFTLAVILGYSLFYLYGGPWAERWSRTNIVFFGDGTRLPLRPFLSSDPQILGGPLRDPDGYHKYPQFLELGVILLEIHLGQKLESYLRRETDITNYDELWCEALRTFQDKRPDFISTVYRDAIEKCLKPNFYVSDTCDEQMLRDSLLKDIVKPLESEVGRAFQEFISIESLDEDAEREIDLGFKAHRYRPNPEVAKAVASSIDSELADPSSCPIDIQLALPQHQEALPIILTRPRPRPASRDEFEIAIVCALPLEYDAVSILIDEWDEDGNKYGRAPGDPNNYETGRIGNYNVVLALLPNMGKVSAAGAAASLRSSFPGLKLALLTGICGGMPTTGMNDEVVLGDVILSASVVQYDFGRLHSDKFMAKDSQEDILGRPSKEIRNLLNSCVTERGRQKLEERAAFFLEKIQDNISQRRRMAKYQYPGAAEDKLFQANYTHRHHGSSQCLCAKSDKTPSPVCDKSRKLSCDELQCDEQYLVRRERIETKLQLEREGRTKEAQTPLVFVGRIGSGDIIVKSGENRDQIAKSHGLIAFEMEGAGVWDEISCIVVKGVCDYADSHKNKTWQHFAAATAASVMKALLEKYTQTDKTSAVCLNNTGISPTGTSIRRRKNYLDDVAITRKRAKFFYGSDNRTQMSQGD